MHDPSAKPIDEDLEELHERRPARRSSRGEYFVGTTLFFGFYSGWAQPSPIWAISAMIASIDPRIGGDGEPRTRDARAAHSTP
jgi:hypothetical protein